MPRINIPSLAAINEGANEFLAQTAGRKIFAFNAPMGAGKTTIIQAILKSLGVMQLEGSPTYGLINSYATPGNGEIFHLDLYRLNSTEEAFDIGIEEIIYDNKYCFIEWPEIIRNLLPTNTVWVGIDVDENDMRTIQFEL
jgi:tRNA threonylcarbamoyladenosine biosynthesis protein TsaE